MKKTALLFLCTLWLIGCAAEGQTAVADGTLLLIEGQAYPNHQIAHYDLNSQQSTPLFVAPEFSQIYQLTIVPNQNQAIFSYSPPPSGGGGFFDRSGLYQLPLDRADSEPAMLLGGQVAGEYLLMPTVSAEGRYLFYAKQAPSPMGLTVTLERYDLQSRQIHLIAFDGIWPRVSPNGRQLVFIGVEPQSLQRALVLTDLSGSQFEILVDLGRFFDIDTPLFSPDGQWIYFSVAENPPPAQLSLLDRMMGIESASAHADHNVPSDWWRISVNGGEPEKLTSFSDVILYGAFHPADQSLIFTTRTGLYALDANHQRHLVEQRSDLSIFQTVP